MNSVTLEIKRGDQPYHEAHRFSAKVSINDKVADEGALIPWGDIRAMHNMNDLPYDVRMALDAAVHSAAELCDGMTNQEDATVDIFIDAVKDGFADTLTSTDDYRAK